MFRTGDGGRVEVRLEEEPDPHAELPGDGTDHRTGRRTGHRTGHRTRTDDGDVPLHRPRRRRRVAGAAGALALVTVLLAVDARAERREAEALRAVADVPGVVAPMADPVQEIWRLSSVGGAWAVGDVLVRAEPAAGLVGRDLATGAVRWSVPVSPDADSRSVTCPYAVRGGGGGLALCTGLDGPRGGGGPSGWGLDPVDLRDGRLLAPLPATGGLFAAGAVDGDLVTVEAAEGGVVVSRHDVRRSVVRWRTELGGRRAAPGMRVTGDDTVVVLEGSTTTVLAAGDGRELGRWVAASDGVATGSVRVVPRGAAGFGVWESRFAGRWHAVDGTPGPRLDGEPVDVGVDDGSAPRIVLLRPPDDGPMRAVDVSTGAEVWRTPAPARVLLRLGGRLVLTRERTLDALDVATGEQLWSVPLGPSETPALGKPFTDGLRLVLRGLDDDGALRLTARDLGDGERLWEAPLPAGSQYVTVLGDRLAVVGEVTGSGAATVLVLG